MTKQTLSNIIAIILGVLVVRIFIFLLTKSMKTKQIIEAEHLMKEFKENLRRLAVLLMIVGVGLIIYGIVKGIWLK